MMQLFDPEKACKIGLLPAIIYQEMIQQEGYRWPLDAEHGVISEGGQTWFRYDGDDLRKIFPYLSLSEIKETLQGLANYGEIDCRYGVTTDYIWVAQRR